MKKNPVHITLITLAFLLAACSAQKNTGISRAYHNLTARYNVLFNGMESFNDGLEKIEKEHRDDFSEILPVFTYDDKQTATIAGSDMDRAIKKCTKLITLHSITAKPKIRDNKTLTADEREFLNKKEYNVFVDDAYLLMGKSHFYKHEFSQASDIFRKIIADYKNQPTTFEAQMWLAKVSIATGKLLDASETLSTLTNNASVPEKMMQEFYPTYADYSLKQKDYPSAITYLEKSIAVEKHKKTRIRYFYILAQLYEKTGELKKASDFYGQVIKMNPVYEMAFNAHINRALTYEEGFGQASQIESELLKMLNDDKNIEYQDQIYYALGNLSVKQGNQKKAVEYYSKSISTNKGNTQQKIRSYLTLADYFYAVPDYPNAQAYYDSVVTYIEPDYPSYNIIFTKSKSLTRLVTELNTVTLGDSVLLLADLPKETLNEKIDEIIAAERKRDEEARAKLQEKQLDEQFGQETAMKNTGTRQTGMNTTNGGTQSQWYFYNDAAKSQGFREFKLRWGNRRLEDHWQRASKAIVNFAPADETAETEDAKTPEASYSKMSREFYLSGIPFTDSAKQATLKDIEAALYNMGLIYKDELKDYDKANESFKSLVKRFPSSSYLLTSYYNLYGIAREQNNQAMMDYYKGIIARDFTGSTYARVLTDPEYFVKLEQEEQQVRDYYKQTYEMYNQGKYADVIARTGYARKTYPSNTLNPQFTYLATLAQGKFSDRRVFRDSLKAVMAKFPNTDIASDAANLISYMDQEHPEIKEAEEVQISRELYDYSPVSKHLFVFAANKNLNANQLVFNIINYNLDKYDSLNLIVEVINLDGKNNLVTVKTFRNQEKATEYLNALKGRPEILKDLPDINLTPFVISDKNLATLKQDKSLDRYLKFYLENYK